MQNIEDFLKITGAINDESRVKILAVPLGIVMSLLIAGGGCSLPELIVLKSMFKMRLLYIFVAMVLAISIGFGFLVIALGI